MTYSKDVVVSVDGEIKKILTLDFRKKSDDVTIIIPSKYSHGIFEENLYNGKNNKDLEVNEVHMSIHYHYNGDEESKITFKEKLKNGQIISGDCVTNSLKNAGGACYVYSKMCSGMMRSYYGSKRKHIANLNPYSKYFFTNYFSVVIASKLFVFNREDLRINVQKIECVKFDIYILQSILDIPSSGNSRECFRKTIGPRDLEKSGLSVSEAEFFKTSMNSQDCIDFHLYMSREFLKKNYEIYKKFYKGDFHKFFSDIDTIKYYSKAPHTRVQMHENADKNE